MATVHCPWGVSVAVFWEHPLGTVETSGGYLWLSGSPDSMSLGAEVTKRSVYGNRYMKKEHLKVLKSNPGGNLGETAVWFNKHGTQSRINRILNTHFQNTTQFAPPPPLPNYVAHYPVGSNPSSLNGFSILRDFGEGTSNAYVWSSCVANNLEVSWKAGEPIFIKPTFVSLDGQPRTSVSSGTIESSTDYQQILAQAPDIIFKWNGTKFHPASFKINSSNNIKIKHSVDSKSPVGMSFGNYTAELELSVWVDSEYSGWFIPDYLGSGASVETLGTFQAIFDGPTVGTSDYDGTINLYGKIVNMPNTQPTKDGLQTIKMIMVDPVTSNGDYTDAGYYFKIDGLPLSWESIVP